MSAGIFSSILNVKTLSWRDKWDRAKLDLTMERAVLILYLECISNIVGLYLLVFSIDFCREEILANKI